MAWRAPQGPRQLTREPKSAQMPFFLAKKENSCVFLSFFFGYLQNNTFLNTIYFLKILTNY
jgi:hypothetical protein